MSGPHHTPKALLGRLYQKLKLPAPAYAVSSDKNASDEYEGTCTISAVETEGCCFEEQKFTGTASSKKVAVAGAAAAARTFVQESGLMETRAVKPPEDIDTVLESILSDQALRKDPDLEGHVYLAQMFKEGRVPASVLCNAKAIYAWFKTYCSLEAPVNLQELCAYLQQKLRSPECVLDVDSRTPVLFIKRKEPYKGRDPEDDSPFQAFQASVNLSKDTVFKAVLIPADDRAIMAEVDIQGGGCYWQKLVSALGGTLEGSELLCWGKVGRVLRRMVPPGHETDDPDNDEQLHATLKQYLGQPLHPRKEDEFNVEGAYAALVREQIAEARKNGRPIGPGLQAAADAICAQQLPTQEVRNPSLYSIYASAEEENQDCNKRASFLAERVVQGDALLAKIRIRPNEWGYATVKWGSFDLALCEEWMASLMPSAKYAMFEQKTPLLSRLPDAYRSPKSWKGHTPEELLARACTPGLVTDGPSYTSKGQMTIDGMMHTASAAVSLIDSPDDLSASSAARPTEDGARQDAALGLLVKLEAVIRDMMFPPGSIHLRPNAPAPPRCLPLRPKHNHKVCEEVVEIGLMTKVVTKHPGSIATINYAIKAPSLDNSVIERGKNCKYQYNSGAVAPEVDALVSLLGIGGRACRNGMWGPDPWADVSLEVELVGWKQPPAQGPSQKLFEVPLAQQRYSFAMDVILKHKAQSVLDLGCGEGRLLEHMLRQGAPLERLVGMDHSADMVQRAERHINRALAEGASGTLQEGRTSMQMVRKLLAALRTSPSTQQQENGPPLVKFLLGDIVEKVSGPGSWGELHGVDVALLIEVVEHLDPDVLRAVGPAVLGSLQPQVLVVSTPNVTYNQVLRRLGSNLLANGLRNSDHRFEWNEEEFQRWSMSLAKAYQYNVRFEGIGKAADEARALDMAGMALSSEAVGYATQAAIFTARSAGRASSNGCANPT